MERWQRAFSAAPFAFGQQRALLAVGVGRATLGAGLRQMDGGHFQLQEIECRNSGAPLLLPPQCGWSWRLGYELDMEAALAFHEALAQGRAHLAFQPIVSSAQLAARLSHTAESGPTGVPLYQEALLRMVARDGEAPLSASRLVAALERLGLVRLFDQAVLSAVIRVLEAQPDLSLGCNLSSLSLVPDEGWWGSVLARLKARPSVASRLTFEITETAPLRDFDHAVALIRRLKALGCRIAIDDLGVGHTRLDFVRAIRPSIIKISADLVHDAAVNRTASEQLERLGAMAAAFAPVVVAEGIGTRRQMDAAWEAGIHWLQGEAAAAHVLPTRRSRCVCPASRSRGARSRDPTGRRAARPHPRSAPRARVGHRWWPRHAPSPSGRAVRPLDVGRLAEAGRRAHIFSSVHACMDALLP